KKLPESSKMLLSSRNGGIAQRSEQAAHNCLVHGSNPCAPTRFRYGKGLLFFFFLPEVVTNSSDAPAWPRRFGYLAKLAFFSSSWCCWWPASAWHGLPRGARTNLLRWIPRVKSLRRRRGERKRRVVGKSVSRG